MIFILLSPAFTKCSSLFDISQSFFGVFLKRHLSANQTSAGCNESARISSLEGQRNQRLSDTSGQDVAVVQSTAFVETNFRESH